MNIPLEDGYTDVLAKAQRGLGMADGRLTETSGITAAELVAARSGNATPEILRALAKPLGLDATALIRLAEKNYAPSVTEPAGFEMFNTPWEDFTVNSYLVWDAATREAIVFDTGADATALLHTIVSNSLRVRLILLTHSHIDHIFELDRVIEKTKALAFTPAAEPVDGATGFPPGRSFSCGSLQVETLATGGHSIGGTTFVVTGLAVPIAIVGDAIFAGSMGGAAGSWKLALTNNREKILALPPETILCPGHGPITSVALELTNNPFFPAQ